MYKEAIICIITVILIFAINIMLDNYTKEAIFEISNELSGLRDEILEENANKEDMKMKIGYIFDRWNDRYEVLAYYLEHDELEKIETNLNSLLGEIETEEYSDAVSEIDRTRFALNHIERKNKFDWKNVF